MGHTLEGKRPYSLPGNKGEERCVYPEGFAVAEDADIRRQNLSHGDEWQVQACRF